MSAKLQTYFLTYFTKIVRYEFSDSQAGRGYSCGKTKTATIINCIGDHVSNDLKFAMQLQPFSIMLDASNDTGIEKMYPITVRIYDVNFNRIMTNFSI